MEKFHSFIVWVGKAFVGLAGFTISACIAASAIWDGARIWTESQWEALMTVMSEPWFWPLFLIALFCYVLMFYWSKPKVENRPTGYTVKDTSLYRSSITLGDNNTIVHGSPNRMLDEKTKQFLIGKVRIELPVDIIVLANDTEAENFAAQIFEHLNASGYTFKYELFCSVSGMSGGGGRIGISEQTDVTALHIGGKDAVNTDFGFGFMSSRGLRLGIPKKLAEK